MRCEVVTVVHKNVCAFGVCTTVRSVSVVMLFGNLLFDRGLAPDRTKIFITILLVIKMMFQCTVIPRLTSDPTNEFFG